MLVPCEVAVKCALPVIRAMIAKELMTKHELKQMEAAKLLGVSQPAISLYCRKIRGKAIDLERDKDVTKLVKRFATRLAEDNLPHREFTTMLCETCKTIRAKGLLCELHKKLDPIINTEECRLCFENDALRCI